MAQPLIHSAKALIHSFLESMGLDSLVVLM